MAAFKKIAAVIAVVITAFTVLSVSASAASVNVRAEPQKSDMLFTIPFDDFVFPSGHLVENSKYSNDGYDIVYFKWQHYNPDNPDLYPDSDKNAAYKRSTYRYSIKGSQTYTFVVKYRFTDISPDFSGNYNMILANIVSLNDSTAVANVVSEKKVALNISDNWSYAYFDIRADGDLGIDMLSFRLLPDGDISHNTPGSGQPYDWTFDVEYIGVADQLPGASSESGDDVTAAIPDNSSGFMSAIQTFVQSMSYEGTECYFYFPEMSIPKIDGVIPEKIVLNDRLIVNLGSWFKKMPSNIMSIVQVLFTLALIVYCFKELYGTIEYVLTLRGNANE